MAVTYLRLSGTREMPDTTMRALIEDNWTAGNITGSITPTFQSATEEPDALAEDDLADVDLITCTWINDEISDEEEVTPNGDTIHHYAHIVRIDIWAQDMTRILEFADEVNRIIWENAPNGATTLPKSDASASEADYFENSELEWERVDPESDVDWRPSLTSILRIHFRKSKT